MNKLPRYIVPIALLTIVGCTPSTSIPTEQPYIIPEPKSGSSSEVSPETSPALLELSDSQSTRTPLITASGTFIESIDNGITESFDTTADLVIDLARNIVTGTLIGTNGHDAVLDCSLEENGTPLVDHATIHYTFNYSAVFNGAYDPASGSFTAAISPAGSATATTITPFTAPQCASLNDEPAPGIGPLGGRGTITGTVSKDTEINLQTSWRMDQSPVSGSWNGVGTMQE